MVTVFSSNNLKFKINDKDHNPPHVHVEGGGASVRINLITMEVMDDETGFNHGTMRRIYQMVLENRIVLLDQWEAVHG
jgi:hypothetical protein